MAKFKTRSEKASRRADSAADEKRQAAAERQRKKREHEARLGMKNLTIRLTSGERELLDRMAEARGYEDRTEYLYSLVVSDSERVERDVSQNHETEKKEARH